MKKIAALALAMSAVAANANLIGYYDFENTLDPTIAANSNVKALEFVEGAADPTAASMNYTTDTVGSTTKTVAQFDRGQGFLANHGIAANGGGAYTNVYSIMFDIKASLSSAGWMSFYQTNDNNSNDGEMFANSTGLGISGNYAGGWTDDVWTRIVMTYDTTTMTIYKDGVLANTIDTGSGIDGRWSLYNADGDGEPTIDHMYLLMDNDGDNGAGYISSVAWWDTALNQTEVTDLGGVGEAVPEPATLTLLALGAFAGIRRRKK